MITQWFRKIIFLVISASSCLLVTAPPSLSSAEIKKLGQRIWKNECGGTINGLMCWNIGEDFASLGIGHFIWFPKGVAQDFAEQFPDLIDFLAARGHSFDFLPGGGKTGCPWCNRVEFLAASNSEIVQKLRTILANTLDEQAQFIVQQFDGVLVKMLAVSTLAEQKIIQRQFDRIAAQGAAGMYALIDYLNFKGSGTALAERYNGKGWGLLQVLLSMQPGKQNNPLDEFADAADKVLTERVKNAPPARGEGRWLAGWRNRVGTYRG